MENLIAYILINFPTGPPPRPYGYEGVPTGMLLILLLIVPLGLYLKMAKNRNWGIRLILTSLLCAGIVAWARGKFAYSDTPTYVIFAAFQVASWTAVTAVDIQLTKQYPSTWKLRAVRAIVWTLCLTPVFLDPDRDFVVPLLPALVVFPWGPLVFSKSVFSSFITGAAFAVGVFLCLTIGNAMKAKFIPRADSPTGDDAKWDHTRPSNDRPAPRLSRKVALLFIVYVALGLFLNVYITSNLPPDIEAGSTLRGLKHWHRWNVPALCHARDEDTPMLLYAIFCGNADAVRYLLDQGYDPNAVHKGYRPTLHIAIQTQNPHTIEVLLEAGVSATKPCMNGVTPLKEAIRSLHFSLSTKVMQMLVRHGADINAVDDEGNTAVHEAVEDRSLHLLRALVAAGADVNLRTKSGKTALDLFHELEAKELPRIGWYTGETGAFRTVLIGAGARSGTDVE